MAQNNFNWNPNARNFVEGSKLLKDCVEEGCKAKLSLEEKHPALKLVSRNVPNDFHKFNEHPRGCVQIQIEIKELIDMKEAENTWHIEIDADARTSTQNPHFGYTLYGKQGGRNIPKFTGHVWLPSDPPHTRPWKKSLGQVVKFSDEQESGRDGLVKFQLKGEMYNQYRQT